VILTDASQLPDLLGHRQLVIDTETSGLSPWHGDRICGIAIGPLCSNETFYIPIRHRRPVSTVAKDSGADLSFLPSFGTGTGPSVPPDPPSPVNIPSARVFQWLRPYFEDPDRAWVLHNAAFDLAMFRAEGLELRGRILDTMVGAHVYDGAHQSSQYALDAVTARLVPGFKHARYHEVKSWLETHQSRKKTWDRKEIAWNYSLVPLEMLGRYAEEDIEATRQVARVLLTHFSDPVATNRPTNCGDPSHSPRWLFWQDMRLVRTLCDMKHRGVRIDVPACVFLRKRSLEEIDRYHARMFTLVGEYFNPASYKAMEKALEKVGGRVLYWMKPKGERGKQKLDMFTDNKDASTGRSCWNAAALLLYLQHYKKAGPHEAFELLQCYHDAAIRQTLVSTNLNAYLRGTDSRGLLHGDMLAHGTITGRMSSQNPNCQNVAKPGGSATQKAFIGVLGDDVVGDDTLARQLRKLFIARPGNVLVSIDYSQIEYRVAARLSEDADLLRRYAEDATTDYHAVTCELAKVDRPVAKNLNFGTLYGMRAPSLASLLTGYDIPTTVREAEGYLSAIFSARPALKRLIESKRAEGAERGIVQNAFGRICKIPAGKAYVALNYLVQGMCGDIMRRALTRVDDWIRERRLPVLMCLTIHDEILFDMPHGLVREVAPLIAEEMCRIPEVRIPFLCDIEVGDNWGEMVVLEDWNG